MSKDKLMRLIQAPDSIQQSDVAELKSLVEIYPYCQIIQLLYAKSLHLFDAATFEKELGKIALTVNRTQLFYLINNYYTEKQQAFKQAEKPTEEIQFAGTDYFAYLENTEDITKNDLSAQNKSKADKLIDSFIQKNPTIKLVPKKDESPVVQPVERPSEDEFFSETLAKIYIKQKRYEKAIKIFEKLRLKYPEKNVYFADQIRFLTIIVNNKK